MEPAPVTNIGEVALLRRAADGDAAAVRELLDVVAPVVYGFVFARVGGNLAVAEDLTQESLIEACRSAPTFRGDAALATWVCAIARRRLARYYEQERRQDLARSALEPVAVDAGREDAEIEARDEVVRALGQLPALHRQVLVLKYLDDRSVAEIATAVGKNRIQVQSLLQRARDGLRRALEEAP
jgi:RNA polymerase sigma-70 factor (ECF subfamily)